MIYRSGDTDEITAVIEKCCDEPVFRAFFEMAETEEQQPDPVLVFNLIIV